MDTMAQRLTFRDKAENVAWQKQLRDKYLVEGIPPVPHLSVKKAIVKPVSRKLAKQIILKYEWLGTMASTNYHYGIFFGMYCAGVCCVGVGSGGANSNAHSEFGIGRYELAYIARGANTHWSPKGANSKLVSWSCKLVHQLTGAKLAIAYSDTDAGEIGTIYQACNWVCVGRGGKPGQIVAPNGRIYDIRNISTWAKKAGVSWGEQKQALLDLGWIEQCTNPKYRYVYVMDKNDKRLVELVESKRTEYPKRDASN